MEIYKNTQVGSFIIILIILIQGFLTIIFLLSNNPNQISLLFYKLVVIVGKKYIYIKYGIGIIKTKILIEKINNVTLVTNKWYYGLGIRIIPQGMLYNIQGLDAVELKFNNTKKIIRIGSNNCTKLKEKIENRIK